MNLTPFLATQHQHLLSLLFALDGDKRPIPTGITEDSNADEVDSAAALYDMEFALECLSRNAKASWEIKEALNRIENGNYGQCEVCNKEIPEARLEAMPFARCDVNCQVQIERGVIRRPSQFDLVTLDDVAEDAGDDDSEDSED